MLKVKDLTNENDLIKFKSIEERKDSTSIFDRQIDSN